MNLNENVYIQVLKPTDKKNAKRNPIHIVTFVEFHKNIGKMS